MFPLLSPRTVESLSLLLISKSIRLFIALMYVISRIHLEKVEPSFALFVLEMMWTYIYYSLVDVIGCPVSSPIHVLCHLFLVLFNILLLSVLSVRLLRYLLDSGETLIIAHHSGLLTLFPSSDQ